MITNPKETPVLNQPLNEIAGLNLVRTVKRIRRQMCHSVDNVQELMPNIF